MLRTRELPCLRPLNLTFTPSSPLNSIPIKVELLPGYPLTYTHCGCLQGKQCHDCATKLALSGRMPPMVGKHNVQRQGLRDECQFPKGGTS